jgi:hypothetical protein
MKHTSPMIDQLLSMIDQNVPIQLSLTSASPRFGHSTPDDRPSMIARIGKVHTSSL